MITTFENIQSEANNICKTGEFKHKDNNYEAILYNDCGNMIHTEDGELSIGELDYSDDCGLLFYDTDWNRYILEHEDGIFTIRTLYNDALNLTMFCPNELIAYLDSNVRVCYRTAFEIVSWCCQ
jgi:hypothetical protein